jgi:elongation factor P
MDMTNYEQITFPKEKIGSAARFLIENMEVEAVYGDGELLDIVLPSSIPAKVVEAPPGMKGDSAASPSKPVTLENGLVVQAPIFIKAGDQIRVSTETGEYVNRV